MNKRACEGGCGRVQIRLEHAAPAWRMCWNVQRLCSICAGSNAIGGMSQNVRTNTVTFDSSAHLLDNPPQGRENRVVGDGGIILKPGQELFRGRMESTQRTAFRFMRKTHPSLHMKILKQQRKLRQQKFTQKRVQRTANQRVKDLLNLEDCENLESDNEECCIESDDDDGNDDVDVFHENSVGEGFSDAVLNAPDDAEVVSRVIGVHPTNGDDNGAPNLLEEEDVFEEEDDENFEDDDKELSQLRDFIQSSDSPVYADNSSANSGHVERVCFLCSKPSLEIPCNFCQIFITKYT